MKPAVVVLLAFVVFGLFLIDTNQIQASGNIDAIKAYAKAEVTIERLRKQKTPNCGRAS